VKIEMLENSSKCKKRLILALFDAFLRQRHGLGWGLI
jgi:hypothetical protein